MTSAVFQINIDMPNVNIIDVMRPFPEILVMNNRPKNNPIKKRIAILITKDIIGLILKRSQHQKVVKAPIVITSYSIHYTKLYEGLSY